MVVKIGVIPIINVNVIVINSYIIMCISIIYVDMNIYITVISVRRIRSPWMKIRRMVSPVPRRIPRTVCSHPKESKKYRNNRIMRCYTVIRPVHINITNYLNLCVIAFVFNNINCCNFLILIFTNY